MSSNAKIERHSWAVRAVHWTAAVSGFVLLFSGFGELPMYKRYNLIKIPGLEWAADFEINLVIHYIASLFFVAAVVFHAVYHLQRREFAVLPRRGDLKESIAIIWAMIRGRQEPPHGKFLAEQRLAYGAIAAVSLLLVLTGLVKTYKNLGDVTLPPTLLAVVTLIHTFAAMLFLALVIAHLAAFLLKANRPLLPSMFNGKVSRDYAVQRHPLWRFEERSTAGERGTVPGADKSQFPRPPITVKDLLRFVPGILVLLSVTLGTVLNPWWFALAVFVGVNLLQSAFSRWCLLESLLLKLGIPADAGVPPLNRARAEQGEGG